MSSYSAHPCYTDAGTWSSLRPRRGVRGSMEGHRAGIWLLQRGSRGCASFAARHQAAQTRAVSGVSIVARCSVFCCISLLFPPSTSASPSHPKRVSVQCLCKTRPGLISGTSSCNNRYRRYRSCDISACDLDAIRVGSLVLERAGCRGIAPSRLLP